MKKLMLVSTLCIAATGAAYASSSYDCDGANRFVANLGLDDARAHEVEQILSSYSHVKDLAKNGRHDEVPAFIEGVNAQLSELLTDDELAQFKENVADWADKVDFSKFMKNSDKSYSDNH